MDQKIREERVAGGVWVLQQISLDNPDFERNAARRLLGEAMRAWPGDVHRLWWKWFSEAAKSLELKTKTLDCTVEEAYQLIEDGARLITYAENPNSTWFMASRKSSNSVKMAAGGKNIREKKVSFRKLKKQLEELSVDGMLRCVVMETTRMPRPGIEAHHDTPPLNRLWGLLRPEWSDIWVVLVFAFVVGLLTLATPIAIESLVNTVAFGRFLQPVVVLALILLTFLGFLAAVRTLQTYVVEIIQRRLFARVAADIAYRLPQIEAEAADGKHVPELVNRFFDVVTVQKVASQLLVDGLGLILSAVIGMAVLAFYHPWLLGFDVILLASIGFIILILGRGAVASSIKESKNKYLMAAWLEDIARCPSTFRNEGGAEFAMERADRLVHQYLLARKSHFRILLRQIMFALGLQAVASTVLLGLGGWLVISGELTLGQLVAAELIVTMIVGAFAKLGKHMESYYDLLASVDKLGVLFDLPIEKSAGMLGMEQSDATEVEIHNVSYSWPQSPKAVSGINHHIAPGAQLAIYGAAGTGKSTLVDLISGVRTPKSGHVKIDDFNTRDLRPDVLRERVAVVRDYEIFHGTIDDNVHLHREDVSAEDVRETMEDLGLLQAALRLKEGCDTILSSDGEPLTMNQCRLLSIARAAVGRPRLLIIDGTLDALPDADLQTALSYLKRSDQPWTLIVATGREWIAGQFDTRLELPTVSTSLSS